MSREKQIKEMAKDLCQNSMCNHDDWCDCDLPDDCYCSRSVRLASNLYNKGYRKQSEVIEEYRKKVYSKMEKYTVFGREYIQRIMREAEKEMKGGAE